MCLLFFLFSSSGESVQLNVFFFLFSLSANLHRRTLISHISQIKMH